MNRKRQNLIDLILNLLILLSTIAAVGVYFVGVPDVLGSSGTGCFKYFTTDSNILCAISSAVMLIYNCRRLKDPSAVIPEWVSVFKFVGTVSVAVTLTTVVFFLAPVASIKGGIAQFFFFFEGNIFALHFSTPVLAIISVALFEKEPPLPRRASLWSLLPTVVYSVVYLVLVVFLKIWDDWYGFTFGGKLFLAPIAMIAMYLLTLALAALLRKLQTIPQK